MEREPILESGQEKASVEKDESWTEFWAEHKKLSDTIEKLKLDLKEARESAAKALDAKNEKQYAHYAEQSATLADEAIEAIEKRERLLNSKVKLDSVTEKELEQKEK